MTNLRTTAISHTKAEHKERVSKLLLSSYPDVLDVRAKLKIIILCISFFVVLSEVLNKQMVRGHRILKASEWHSIDTAH